MTNGRTLVIGFTPTEGGTDAVSLGRILAETTAARPIVLSALPWPENLVPAGELESALSAETRGDFEAVAEQLAGLDPGFAAVASHAPAAALQELARETGAEMIVIGSAHRGPVGRTLAGSTGHSLLHGAPCPVAVAPRGFASGQAGLTRIGVGFDGSAPSWGALETGIATAERLHGSLEVLIGAEPSTYGYSVALGVLSGEGIRTEERSRAKRLAELASGRIPREVPHEVRGLHGNAGRMLAGASRGMDLLLCGSRGYGPVLQTALGSTTRHLIDHAECPVVVLPRGRGLDPMKLSASALVSA